MTFEYTKEIEARMAEVYNEARETNDYAKTNAAVEALAKEFGIKPAQVRAKLVTLDGVEYLAKPKARKTVATKDKLVAAIAEALEIPEVDLDTMTKATKDALAKVFGKINGLREKAELPTVAVK